jgi:hypothetical protein
MLRAGDTFYAPEREGDEPHLYVVLTDRDKDGKAVCVNLTSNDSDKTTLCSVGDHPFIRWNCFVAYRRTQKLALDKVEDAMRTGRTCKQDEVARLSWIV